MLQAPYILLMMVKDIGSTVGTVGRFRGELFRQIRNLIIKRNTHAFLPYMPFFTRG